MRNQLILCRFLTSSISLSRRYLCSVLRLNASCFKALILSLSSITSFSCSFSATVIFLSQLCLTSLCLVTIQPVPPDLSYFTSSSFRASIFFCIPEISVSFSVCCYSIFFLSKSTSLFFKYASWLKDFLVFSPLCSESDSLSLCCWNSSLKLVQSYCFMVLIESQSDVKV